MKPPLTPKLLPVLLLLQLALPVFSQDDIDRLLAVKESARSDSITAWYFSKTRPLDSASSMRSFNILLERAADKKDKIAVAAATFYKGQYTAIKLSNHLAGIKLMEEAITLADRNGNKIQAATFRHHVGFYYFSGRNAYSKALQNMLSAEYTFRNVGREKVLEPAYNLYRLAFVYYHLGNYHEALKHLHDALQYPDRRSYVNIFITNTIGQCYRNLMQFDSALHYYNLTYQLAVKGKDEPWMGISTGNIGFIHIAQNNYTGARPYFDQYLKYVTTASEKDTVCISEALTGLADIDIEEQNYGKAQERLKEAERLLFTVFQSEEKRMGYIAKENYVRQRYLLKTYAKLYERTNDQAKALGYLREANVVRDSLERRGLLSGYEAIQQQLEAEQHFGEINLLEKEKQNEVLKQYLIIAASASLVIILLMGYNRQKLKRVKDLELQQKKDALLVAAKEKVEAELRHARQLLDNYTDNLRQKNDLLDQVQTEISALRTLHGDDQSTQVLYLNTLARSTILTEKDWDEFSELFDKVHTGFFVKLRDKHPNITPAETRLLSLTKLRLSTKEMAGMLGVSADTIKKTRQRLRRKLEMAEDKSLEDLIEVL
jgi:tetratricopeptide (TPR) repeat protein